MTTTSARIGDICVAAVLLQKAYLVTNRNRWVLLFIPVIAASAPIILYISWSAPTIMTIDSGCIFVYPEYFPWLRFGLHAPMNIALTGIFFNVVYRQWKQFGTHAWEQLAKEGIQVGLLMLLSNLLCTFFVAFEVLGLYSIMIVLADCNYAHVTYQTTRLAVTCVAAPSTQITNYTHWSSWDEPNCMVFASAMSGSDYASWQMALSDSQMCYTDKVAVTAHSGAFLVTQQIERKYEKPGVPCIAETLSLISFARDGMASSQFNVRLEKWRLSVYPPRHVVVSISMVHSIRHIRSVYGSQAIIALQNTQK
ncbi:hypothetical protein THASP1DRAFT_22944 [Thamnocephalis sphaerospora]|uniref:Uncharacterized protein n=1 Tax=Thamnocephalis sphaerospora TaxID=78915 RepID=A0A4P9XST1_9FUNG|nr:hypothetical protein THASP1DRAFT_22944 [Thamnocephalis sphaerospora]|eukprot:RKP09176.1 hypothetical protein THASP1DRAFT_22944 [Thamnocephalis sphaerospora]